MKHEISSLTGLRGMAALHVVIFHFMKDFFSKQYDELPSTINMILKNFVSHGYLAVDIFFMLSAFVLTLSYKKYFAKNVTPRTFTVFMIKRFRRLYPTYFVCLIITMVVFKNYSIVNFIVESLFLQIFTDVNLYNYNLATWSLSVEWLIYLAFPFFLYITQKFSNSFLLVLLVFSLALLYYIQSCDTTVFSFNKMGFVHVSASYNLNIHFGFLAILRGLIAYFLGYLIYQFHRFIQGRILFFLSILTILFALIYNLNDLFIIIAFVFFFAGILKENIITEFLKLPIINYLGRISYSLYLFHLVILNALLRGKLDFTHPSISFYALAIFLSLLFAAISYELFEKRLTAIIFSFFKKYNFSN